MENNTISAAENFMADRSFSEDDHGHAKKMQAFLETRAGVKGLVDSGIKKIPSIFIRPPGTVPKPKASLKYGMNIENNDVQIPEIDLQGFESDPIIRTKIVDAIRDAAKTWGTFRMVNHGVPVETMENMLEGVRRFHEQPLEVKKAWYSCSREEKGGQRIFERNTNVKIAAWRDTMTCEFPDGVLNEQFIPQVCRKATSEYMRCMLQLKRTLSELIAEALGLRSDYIATIEDMKGALIACHYYPACPEPELTLGTGSHTDPCFFTILLEDNIDGLQVFHHNQWVNVPHRHGYLTAMIGDFLQIMSNDKFKSVKHRVLAGGVGPRMSVACFFAPVSPGDRAKPFEPAEELLSKENPPIYKGTSFDQYLPHFSLMGRDGHKALPHFKIST